LTQPPPAGVTWVKVEPPSFDLWGVLVASLGITGILAGIALVLGVGFGAWLIRRRRLAAVEAEALLLRLDPAVRP
jgi:hypothetical protein